MDVVFDTDAAKPILEQCIDSGAVDYVGKRTNEFIVSPNGRHQVDTRFDGHDHPRLQVAIEPKELVAKLRPARSTRGVPGQVAEVFHVVHVEPQQMPEPVSEKERVSASPREFGRVAA